MKKNWKLMVGVAALAMTVGAMWGSTDHDPACTETVDGLCEVSEEQRAEAWAIWDRTQGWTLLETADAPVRVDPIGWSRTDVPASVNRLTLRNDLTGIYYVYEASPMD